MPMGSLIPIAARALRPVIAKALERKLSENEYKKGALKDDIDKPL